MSVLELIHQPSPDSDPEAIVAIDEVSRRYGEGDTAVDALRGVSLEIERGRLTAVMGPSGSGKSTLMHILAGLDRPTSGRVVLDGVDITRMSEKKLTLFRRDKIGFVFQFFNLLPMLTAEENVVLPLDIAGEKVDREWLEDLLTTVGIEERRKHRPSELSGGQQQRVAIARGARLEPRGPLRRRADGQPRLGDVEGRPPRAAQRRRRPRADDGDGHPRRRRGLDGRPHPLHRRRPHRQGPQASRRLAR